MKIFDIFNLDKTIAKKNIELKDISNKFNLKEKEYLKLIATTFLKRQEIYNQIREDKIKNNKLIELKGYEIVLETKKKSFLSKIPILNLIFSEDKNKNYLKALYFGYGNQATFLDIELDNNTTIINKKELYNIKYTDKNYFINGTPLKFINKDTIFDSDFDSKNNKFVYEISPEYYFEYIDKVINYKLTNPKNQNLGLVELLKKYWWVILIMLGLYYWFEKDKNKTTPLILPFIFFYKNNFLNWLKK